MNPTDRRDLITVGASAGGLDLLARLVAQLPGDLPAAVCIVQHLAPQSPGGLAEIIGRKSSLPVRQAEAGAPLEHGRIYMAPPGCHLLVEPGRLHLSHGPRENRARPAIDPLFRSAASVYGPRVVGIVLSGMLDDGTMGLRAIKQAGGVAVVQDPGEAPHPSMPQSALDHVAVDHVRPVAEMGALLNRLVRSPLQPSSPSPEVPSMNSSADEQNGYDAERTQEELVALACPACGGPLKEVSGEPLHSYQCHIGHRYTSRVLLDGQDEAVEQALEVALRTLEERNRMLTRMAREERESGRERMAGPYEERAEETQAHAESIRSLLERDP